MFAIKLLSLSCLLVTALATADIQIHNRIVGGDLTTIEAVPYLVQFRYAIGGGVFCGGTLLAPHFVVTAAHCIGSKNINSMIVVGGVSTMSEVGLERRVVSIHLHPEYNADDMHSDVAVIRLAEPMWGTNIKPIPLCQQPLRAGDFVQVSGWGKTGATLPMSQQLRTMFVQVTPFATCHKEFSIYVKKNMFCASGVEAKGICMGDSGGPAVHRGQLCGINAFVYKCGVPGHTSAFTDVYSVRSFIEGIIRKEIANTKFN